MNTILLIKQLFAISHCDILTIKAQKFIVINQMRNFTRTSFCEQFFSLMMEFSSVSEYIFFQCEVMVKSQKAFKPLLWNIHVVKMIVGKIECISIK